MNTILIFVCIFLFLLLVSEKIRSEAFRRRLDDLYREQDCLRKAVIKLYQRGKYENIQM